MKRSELAFVLALIPLDMAAMVAAFALAYQTRLATGVISVWDFATFIRFVVAFVPFWTLLFAIEGLYRIRWSKKLVDEIGRIFLAVSSAMMLVVGWIFLSRTEFFSRLVVIYGWGYAFALVVLLRIFLRGVQRSLLSHNIGIKRVIVVGDNGVARKFVSTIQQDKSLGLKLMKLIHRGQLAGLGKLQIIKETDEIILADSQLDENEILKLIDFCEEHRITFRMIPNLFKVHSINVDVAYYHGIPLLEFKKSPLGGWWRIIKRLLDVLASLLAIIVTSPIMFLCAVAIKIDSPGTIIYKNERVGPSGTFNVYKFRTLFMQYCVGNRYGGKIADKLEKRLIQTQNTRKGGIYKIKNDPRITKIGGFLRLTSLDELPNLFNVLRGEMSLVGPRPHQQREVRHYESQYQKLLHVKPGITGLAQISGRSDLDTEEEVKLDTFYIENWSLWLDVQIILRTPIAILHKREVV